jgi:hypothetical protein
MLGDLDMIIEAGAALLPFGILVGLGRQRLERRPVELLEQLPAGCAEMTRDAPVESDEKLGDRLIEFGETEETVIAQAGQNAALDDLNADFHFRLVARFARPRRYDRAGTIAVS